MTPLPTALGSLPDFVWTSAELLVPRLILALVILVAGVVAASWAARAVTAALARAGHIDETARPAIAAAARYGALIVTFIAALSQIGVQTASLLAALGAAGLAMASRCRGRSPTSRRASCCCGSSPSASATISRSSAETHLRAQ
jgi:small-conductance mechanosensitive channel